MAGEQENAQVTLDRIHKAALSERRYNWLTSTIAYVLAMGSLFFMAAHVRVLEHWVKDHRAYIKDRDDRWEQRFDHWDRSVVRILGAIADVGDKIEQARKQQ